MTDLDRYLQKAIIDACNDGSFKMYTARPDNAAITPYGVVTISKEMEASKCVTLYRVTVTINLYDEYREYGGMKLLNERSDAVVTALLGDLSVTNFNVAGSWLVSTSTPDIDRQDSVDVYRKQLIFTFLIS